jgi:hypothetical protein
VIFLGAVTFVLVLVANVDDIVTLANVGALVAMLVVNGACLALVRGGWQGSGIKLPGGYLIPALGVLTCLSQFGSLDLEMVLLGVALVVAGLLLFASRQQIRLGEGLRERVREAIEALETPLAKALSDPGRAFASLRGALGGPR